MQPDPFLQASISATRQTTPSSALWKAKCEQFNFEALADEPDDAIEIVAKQIEQQFQEIKRESKNLTVRTYPIKVVHRFEIAINPNSTLNDFVGGDAAEIDAASKERDPAADDTAAPYNAGADPLTTCKCQTCKSYLDYSAEEDAIKCREKGTIPSESTHSCNQFSERPPLCYTCQRNPDAGTGGLRLRYWCSEQSTEVAWRYVCDGYIAWPCVPEVKLEAGCDICQGLATGDCGGNADGCACKKYKPRKNIGRLCGECPNYHELLGAGVCTYRTMLTSHDHYACVSFPDGGAK